jgi:flagellar basal-body rod protein FlgG
MNGAFYIAATGLRAQEQATQITANNVANWNTVGFKRERVRFAEIVAAQIQPSVDERGAAAPAPLSGVRVDRLGRDMSAGELRETNDAFDLAISGDGFIEVLGASGETLLWRGGQLKFDADGRLATVDGLVLKSQIRSPDANAGLKIARDGTVEAVVDGKPQQLGRIDLCLARDEAALSSIGGGLFRTSNPDEVVSSSPGVDGGELRQGFQEGSNVRLSDEMVGLLLTQRAFAANSQIVQAADQLMSIANNLRR